MSNIELPATSLIALAVTGQYTASGLDSCTSPAYKEITAFAGGGQTNATPVGFQRTHINAGATNGDSVRLLGNSDISPYSLTGGLMGFVMNTSTKTIAVFPPSGLTIFLGGTSQGANNSVNLPNGSILIWLIDNDINYHVWTIAA